MVRTMSHLEDEVSHDSFSPTDIKIVDQKVNALRSKHSETEQRRRSKINERFQILRDLIPENDQKRDKASFLLEVIQYIEYLHGKLQMYEGSCQGWIPESTKCFQSRINSGPVESFIDQSQYDRNFYGHEDNVIHPPLLSHSQNSLDSEFTNLPMTTQALPLEMPLQPAIFDGVPGQPHQESFCDAEQLNQPSQPHFWSGRLCGDVCSVPIYAANEEELRSERRETSISIGYSKGLLNSLKSALQSSGVDLSETSISVQLDVGKQTNGTSNKAIFHLKDQENATGVSYGLPMILGKKNYEHPQKRFRAD